MNTFEEMYREQLHARRRAETETRRWIDTAQIFADKADQLQDDLDEANDDRYLLYDILREREVEGCTCPSCRSKAKNCIWA